MIIPKKDFFARSAFFSTCFAKTSSLLMFPAMQVSVVLGYPFPLNEFHDLHFLLFMRASAAINTMSNVARLIKAPILNERGEYTNITS